MAMTTGVVLVRTGSSYRVYTDAGEVTAVLRGKLRRRDDDRIVAGDVVELALQPDGPATISRVRPRRSVLARRAAGERSPRVQPLAANVDQVVVVASARDPEPNLRLLDRFLVIAEANRIPAVIVLNKIELERRAAGVFQRRFGPAGYQVLPTSVRAAEGLPALRDLLRGRASVLTGPSGVGKSRRGAWTRMPSAAASPSSADCSTRAASTTAATSWSRTARCGGRRRKTDSILIGWSPTSGSTRKSACPPGPAVAVARGESDRTLGELRQGVRRGAPLTRRSTCRPPLGAVPRSAAAARLAHGHPAAGR